MANIKIRARNSVVTHLVRPHPNDDVVFEAFVSDADGFGAYVHRDVLDSIACHAKRAGYHEAIGLLAGRICHDPKCGPYTLVMAADGAREGEFKSTSSYVELLASGHEKVRRRLENAHPDREIVGWYHTHPHHPPSFSYVDAKEQATWNDANHIGIVYSGTDAAGPFGVYRGPSAILLRRYDSAVAEPGQVNAPGSQSSRQNVPSEPRLLPQLARPGGQEKLVTALLCAVTLLFVSLLGDLSWLHRRLSSVEQRMRQLMAAESDDHRRIQSREQPSSTSGVQPSPAADRSTVTSGPANSATLVAGPDLRPPAKPLVRAVTSRPRPRERREAHSPREAQEKEPGRNSSPEGGTGKPRDPSVDVKTTAKKPPPQDAAPKANQPRPPR